MKMLLVAIFIAFTPSAFATDWQPFTKTSKGETIYIDLDSIKSNGTFVKIWQRQNISSGFNIAGKGIAYSTTVLNVMDCSQKVISTQQTLFYAGINSTGDILWSSSDNNAPFEDAVPGSVAEATLKFACSFLPKPRQLDAR